MIINLLAIGYIYWATKKLISMHSKKSQLVNPVKKMAHSTRLEIYKTVNAAHPYQAAEIQI